MKNCRLNSVTMIAKTGSKKFWEIDLKISFRKICVQNKIKLTKLRTIQNKITSPYEINFTLSSFQAKLIKFQIYGFYNYRHKSLSLTFVVRAFIKSPQQTLVAKCFPWSAVRAAHWSVVMWTWCLATSRWLVTEHRKHWTQNVN